MNADVIFLTWRRFFSIQNILEYSPRYSTLKYSLAMKDTAVLSLFKNDGSMKNFGQRSFFYGTTPPGTLISKRGNNYVKTGAEVDSVP
jgi:hypothetical protein